MSHQPDTFLSTVDRKYSDPRVMLYLTGAGRKPSNVSRQPSYSAPPIGNSQSA